MFKQIIAGAAGFFINTLMALRNFITGFIQGVLASFETLYTGITGKMISIQDKVRSIMNSLPGIVRAALDAITGMIANFNPIIKIGLELPDIIGQFNSLRSQARKAGVPGLPPALTSPLEASLGSGSGDRNWCSFREVPASSTTTSPSRWQVAKSVHIDQVVIRSDADIETLARRIEWYRRTGGGR